MRYLRLYLYFLQFSFSKALQFRLEFTFRIFMDLAYHLLNLYFFKTIFQYTNFIEGWNEDQVILFVCGFILNDAIYMTFFSTNCWWLPIHINKGELDYYLTKPIRPLFFLSLKDFAANSFVNLLVAIGLFVWALIPLWGSFTLLKFSVYCLLLLNGAVLWYLFHLLFYLPVFWTQSPRGFESLLWGFDNIVKYPHMIQKGFLRIFFTYILPLNLMISFPTSYLLSDEGGRYFLVTSLGLSLLIWSIVMKLWSMGLRRYSSASS